jgi:hypothetical protein
MIAVAVAGRHSDPTSCLLFSFRTWIKSEKLTGSKTAVVRKRLQTTPTLPNCHVSHVTNGNKVHKETIAKTVRTLGLPRARKTVALLVCSAAKTPLNAST